MYRNKNYLYVFVLVRLRKTFINKYVGDFNNLSIF